MKWGVHLYAYFLSRLSVSKFKPFDVGVEMFHEKHVNIMATDALAPCVASTPFY